MLLDLVAWALSLIFRGRDGRFPLCLVRGLLGRLASRLKINPLKSGGRSCVRAFLRTEFDSAAPASPIVKS